MASGWAGDGAVQDQIQDSINDEVARARATCPKASLHFCESAASRSRSAAQGPPGVRLCVACQEEADKDQRAVSLYNRRGSRTASCVKSGDGKIGESLGGRRRGGTPPDDGMGEARRGRRLSGALQAEASSIKPPIISGGAALCAGRAVSLRHRAVRPGLTSAAWRGITSFSSIRMPRNLM
ncbi:MAG: TraR/DksA family transcriptional regulator [Bilophila wadsworthia]